MESNETAATNERATRYTAVMRRPRFSMKWLLISFTILSMIFYVLFIRPTVIANRFASAANSGNYEYALSLIPEGPRKIIAEYLDGIAKPTFKVAIYAREWSDIWRLQRRLLIQIIPGERKSGSQLPDVGLGSDAVATISGVSHLKIYFVTYGPNPSGVSSPAENR
jgi:hypothetical protein